MSLLSGNPRLLKRDRTEAGDVARARLYAGIFFFSFSALSYEIILTRLFSISLWYHFAFMVISIAMLGIGASGTALSLYPGLKVPSRIGLYGMFLGAGISLSYIISNHIPFDPVRLSWDRIQLIYISLYYIVLSIPFFFFGLCISTALSMISERAGILYGSDLLGAGTGSIVLLTILSIIAPEDAVVVISSIALTGALITGGLRIGIASVFLILFNISLIFTSILEPRMSPYKGLQLALRYPGAEHIKTYNTPFSRIDIFKSPAARFAPGLSLKYLEGLPEQIGISIDGGDINGITNAEKKESLGFLKYLPSSLPYEIGRKNDVLIIEPRGGLEVLLAIMSGSENIYKVDSNPYVIKVIRDTLDDFSGGIYREKTWSGMGRSWLKGNDRRFDIIDMPLIGASPSGSFGIAEDYRFTVEAFKEYLQHLNNNGILSINLFILPPPRIELRLLGTIARSMEEMGIRDVEKRIAAIRSWGTLCILAKRSVFEPHEIDAIRRFSKERRFDLVYLPGIKGEDTNVYVKMPSDEYPVAFKEMLSPETRQRFQHSYIFDIRPVRDENPFFHYFLRLKNLKRIYDLMGRKWQFFIEEGYLLPAVFIQVLLLSIALTIMPAMAVKTRIRGRGLNPDLNLFLYFASIGLGFMFVEVSLIQKMILTLEIPFYAAAAVLTSILIGSGIGSLLGYRFTGLRRPCVLIALSFLIIVYSLLIPPMSVAVSQYSLPFKILLTFTFLIPLSMLMGIPFPTGLKALGEKCPDLIPWAWAINGCLSILAPIAAIMLAMAAGFKAVLWIGSGTYLLAFFTFPSSGPLRS